MNFDPTYKKNFKKFPLKELTQSHVSFSLKIDMQKWLEVCRGPSPLVTAPLMIINTFCIYRFM